MGKDFPALRDDHREWIAKQHMFFVATAPSGDGGNVNLSPKGYDTFRVLDEGTVAYLDLTGSGVETIAHLQQNHRLTIMFCAFEGKPNILRIYGHGEHHKVGTQRYEELSALFGDIPGVRGIVTLEVNLVRSSCGYSIPFMEYEGERDTLVEWAQRRGPDGIEEYWAEKNTSSIDGLPGLA